MKRELQLDDIYINVNHFHNPVSQQTFDSLPKIYGTIKHRIYSNKLKFYEMIDKSFKRKRNQNSEEKTLTRKKSSKVVKTQKSQSKAETVELKELKISLQRQKISKQINKELIKRRKIKDQIDQAKAHSLQKKISTDHESKHKVKFNTLRLHPVLANSSGKHSAKPQTLTELMDNKITRTLTLNTPLVNLYKKKSQKLIFNGCDQYIREQASEEDSHPNSPKKHYIPKQLLRNMKLKKDAQDEQVKKSLQKKVKTETNSPGSVVPQQKKKGVTTVFSIKIAENSFQKITKLIPVGQNKRFKIPTKDQYKELLKNYYPMNPSFNLQGLIEKQTFQIVASDKSVYFGQFSDEMHGFGIFVTPQFVFQGHFQKGQMLDGSELNYDGIYTGHYCNNLRQGKGRFQWNNGQIYEGEWKAGRKDGHGIWRSYNGDSYEGQWVNGRQEGVGTRKHKNNIYKGELLNSCKHGKGEEYFQNGDHYQGSYEHGKPHGFGRYDWRDGSYYQGEFVNGYREGKGQLHQKNGATYKVKALSGEILSMGWVNRFKQQDTKFWAFSKRASWPPKCKQLHDLPKIYISHLLKTEAVWIVELKPMLPHSRLHSCLLQIIIRIIDKPLEGMRNLMNYYQFMMQRSLPLKITIFVMLISFPFSLIITIISFAMNCPFSAYSRSCFYLFYNNPYECPVNGQQLCCGLQGNLVCQGYFNCLAKPEAQNAVACEAMVIASWVLYLVFIISTIVFFMLNRSVGQRLADEYRNMNQGIEISQQNNLGEQGGNINNRLL